MVYLTDYTHKSIDGYLYYTELEATFEPEYTGEHTFGLTVYGTGKLFIDDELIVDNSINQKPGDSFWGAGTREEIGTIELTAGIKHKILVEFGTAPTQKTSTLGSTNMGAGGFRLGCIRNTDAEAEIAAAVAVAQAADQVIICAGLNVSINMVDSQYLMWCIGNTNYSCLTRKTGNRKGLTVQQWIYRVFQTTLFVEWLPRTQILQW